MDVSPYRVNVTLVFDMLGCRWPDVDGFDWSSVHHFRIERGSLIPYGATGRIEGPSLRLVLCDWPFNVQL